MATHTVPEAAVVVTEKCYLRPYEASDAEALAVAANDPEIVKNMRSGFPSPYTLSHAQTWIEMCRAEPVSVTFGIFSPEGEYAGAVTLMPPKGDVIYAGTREIGYFAARRFWGRGIMSEAVRGFTRWAFATLPDLLRIEASTFESNLASQRVLEKAGFVKEGTRRLAVVKNGKQFGETIFGLTRPDIEG
ncbi:acetyltransferase [Nemania sp. NC0429]|nr:acetyltransferase [Nemania sp. NC0429]